MMDAQQLEAWLNPKSVEFACVLAVRAALRVVPVLEYALYNDQEDRRRRIILPSLRALAGASFAAALPMRAGEVCSAARRAALDAQDAIIDLANGTRMAVVEANDAVPELSEYIWGLENDARAVGLAVPAVEAIMQSAQATVDAVDSEKGIARPDSVHESTVAAAVAANGAIDAIHGNTDFFDESEEDEDSGISVSAHVAEFWKAAEDDTRCLDAALSAGLHPEQLVVDLNEKPLWLNGTPVWAVRQWTNFKDTLPDKEGWQVWIDWYEARLVGGAAIEDLEFVQTAIRQDDWDQGPVFVNAKIGQLIEARTDPLLVAVRHGFEELGAVSPFTSIDLSRHRNRISNALSDDPHQAIGATKEMLEAAMKTILNHRGHDAADNISFSELTTRSLSELGLKGTSPPASEGERHVRTVASCAQRMIETVNRLRNKAGTGHGRVLGDEPEVSAADAALVASTGLILVVWLLRHHILTSE